MTVVVEPVVSPAGTVVAERSKSNASVAEEGLMLAFVERARATQHPGGVHDLAVDEDVRKALKWSERR